MKGNEKTQKKNIEPWSEVSSKLDTLIRLSALNVVKGMETQKEKIVILSDAGFQPKDIAEILQTTSNTVSVALNAIRKDRNLVKVEEEKKEKPTESPVEAPTTETKSEVKEDTKES